MHRLFIFILLMATVVSADAQSARKPRKYPSLLWEITGPGLKKPSYLFGTMHVSSKLAFHLADSFYIGIRKADIVALETNPESWQEDMNNYASDMQDDADGRRIETAPNDFFSRSTLRFFRYDKKLQAALSNNPSAINNLLYRSYGNESSDFEEDTYLDMYIYQCGKKWGKKVTGVENYAQSMQLMAEAYKDAEKDPLRRYRNEDAEEYYSASKLQDAYRSGNLDWLDSINKINSFSPAFDEKFMYLRNDIQAASIDSIIRTGQSLFVGVGAAHLPGHRGVIEWLRRKGYSLRPVKMGARDSHHKNQVEKLRVPVQFNTQTAPDGFYKVDIPGKFYSFGADYPAADQRQYADMANGSYYMVSRIMTNAWMWGHSKERVSTIIDSLLYENIPGRIISRKAIVRNGYKGFDISNRTRRGDLQRYHIFITPFEIIVFKMSGIADYVSGPEAGQFFNSIRFGEEQVSIPTIKRQWQKFSPPGGGFSIQMPHQPYTGNDGSWIFDAEDVGTGTNFRVIRTDIHNYGFAGEDSFDLGMLDESFMASDFIDQQLTRRHLVSRGYAALDVDYKDKYGKFYFNRYLVRGPHYYSVIAHGNRDTLAMRKFVNSFLIEDMHYGPVETRTDTLLKFTVKSPVFPVEKKSKPYLPGSSPRTDDDIIPDFKDLYRNILVRNDTTGERIHVALIKVPDYMQLTDSVNLGLSGQPLIDTLPVMRMRKEMVDGAGWRVSETKHTDSASSRVVWRKIFTKANYIYTISTLTDTTSRPSAFLSNFYNTFTPQVETGMSPFIKKSKLLFSDFLSSDTNLQKKAVKGMVLLKPDSSDLPALKQSITSLTWKQKQYMEVKKMMIAKLGTIKTKAAADYAKELFYAAGDTLELQHSALESLLNIETAYAYEAFKNILVNETPVTEVPDLEFDAPRRSSNQFDYDETSDGKFLDELTDSLLLTKAIIKDILPLINLDEYEDPLLEVLATLVDSNMVEAMDYELYYPKIMLQAKQQVRKHAIMLKQLAISKATKEQAEQNDDDEDYSYNASDNRSAPPELLLYSRLLLPFWKKEAAVPQLVNQMFSWDDDELKFRLFNILLRAGKPVPDTIINHFAKSVEYRHNLYVVLRGMDKLALFPAEYNNHISLATSKLTGEYPGDKSDSIVYLDRVQVTVKNKTGYVYFFKYKKKKETGWKLSTAGLIPMDSTLFMFPKEESKYKAGRDWFSSAYGLAGAFTNVTATRFRADQPVGEQIARELKKLLYSIRRSSSLFYNGYEEENYDDDDPQPDAAALSGSNTFRN